MDGKHITPESQLERYLRALRPIVYIHHFDFQTVDEMIDSTARKVLGGKACVIEEYSEAGGRIDFETKSPKRPGVPMALEEFLSRFNTSQLNEDRHNYLLVLKEVHERLAEPRVVSLLQTLARRTKMADEALAKGQKNLYRVQVLIVDTQLTIPPSLEKLTTLIDIRPPDDDRIGKIIDDVVKAKKGLQIAPGFKPELVLAFAGLSEFEIRQILALAAEDNMLDADDLPLIHGEKRQLIRKSGLLELIDSGNAGVGGLEALRKFVAENREIFKHPGTAKEYGVDAPAGVMIVGMPGCGKSLMAKTIAREFGVPLLKLDVGRLMGKYVGESENNLHRAVAVAEAAAPCVLWIDEIEKAFSGIGEEGGGGGSMTRMFGIFLTWMQEKTACIYVVATANNIEKLPPEFLRRGRFDEIFQVQFPNAKERRAILEVHVRKRNHGEIPSGLDLDKAAKGFADAENYSGADIESIVKDAMKRVFTENMKSPGPERKEQWKRLSTEVLSDVIRNTKSSYHSQKEKLDKMMKKLADLDAKSAT